MNDLNALLLRLDSLNLRQCIAYRLFRRRISVLGLIIFQTSFSNDANPHVQTPLCRRFRHVATAYPQHT